MRLFFSKHELKLRRKRTIAAVVCMVIVLGVYWILTRPQKAAPEMPTVIVEPVIKDDVEICFNDADIVTGSKGYEHWWSREYKRRSLDDL